MPAPRAAQSRNIPWLSRLSAAGVSLVAALGPAANSVAMPASEAMVPPAAAVRPSPSPVPMAAAPAVAAAATAGGPSATAEALPDWPSLAQMLSLPSWLTLSLELNATPIANPIGGLKPSANWMQQLELNVSASRGLSRDPSQWQELDHWQAQLRLDLYSGTPNFASDIGSLIAPQTMAYPPGLWLSGASLSRSNRSKSFSVTAGLRSLDPDFLAAPAYNAYLFSAINDTLNLNILGLPISPFAAPALTLHWRSGSLGEWRLGAFWLGGQAETASLFGVDADLPELDGQLQILQWSMAPTLKGFDTSSPIRRRDGDSVARQLPPPLLQLGAMRNRVTSTARPSTNLQVGGIGLNHVVYGSFTLPARLPLGLDNRLWSAAQLDLNPGRDGTPLFLGGGWLCQGLFPDRPLDVLALGVAGTVFSRQLLPQLSHQIAVELNYSFTLNNSLSLQPVLQWIVRPSGSAELAPVLTTALQVVLSF